MYKQSKMKKKENEGSTVVKCLLKSSEIYEGDFSSVTSKMMF